MERRVVNILTPEHDHDEVGKEVRAAMHEYDMDGSGRVILRVRVEIRSQSEGWILGVLATANLSKTR